jgi:hypothetical protein
MPDNDFDYDEIQEKLNPPSVDTPDESLDVNEDMDDWTTMTPVDEPEEKESNEEKAPEAKAAEVKEQKAPEASAEDLKDALIQQNGEDFVLKVKGVERRLKDIPSTELKAGLQKAFRSDQIFNELSSERKTLEDSKRQYEEQKIRQDAELQSLRREMDTLRAYNPARRTDPRYGQLDEAETGFSPTDSPEARQYKAELTKTQERLNQLEEKTHQSSQVAYVSGVESEIKALSKDFPMAPLDEVIAVKLARPDVKTEDLMRAAHDYYRGDQHIELALANNPEYKKRLEEKMVKDFIAKRQSAKKIAGVPRSSSGSGKVESKGKSTPIRDFKDARNAATAYIREMERKGQD